MTPEERAAQREARRAAREAALDAHIRQVVDEAPPLTAAQKDRLAFLLRRPFRTSS